MEDNQKDKPVQTQPSEAQIKEAQKDPSKRVVEGKDGTTHILERMQD